jgi:hypothetical protein
MIDKANLEIRQDEDKTVYKSLEEVGDDLPDHSPRFVLLSYPLTLVRNVLILRCAERIFIPVSMSYLGMLRAETMTAEADA